jgi:5'-nucleotidase
MFHLINYILLFSLNQMQSKLKPLYIASHGLLQQGDAYYDAKRQALYDHYHPLEISPVIPIDEKTKLMEEWWGKTHELLIEGGLTYDAIKKSVANSSIAFREGVSELFEFLEVNKWNSIMFCRVIL